MLSRLLYLTFILFSLAQTANASSISLAVNAPNEVMQGENFTIYITANASDIGSLQLELIFSNDVLEPTGVKQNVNAIATYGIKENKIVLGYISIQGINGNLTIAEIEFNALNAGMSNLNLSVIDATDTKNNPASVESVINSTVCIQTQAPTQEKTAELEKTPVETAIPNETTTVHETPTLTSMETEVPLESPTPQTTKIIETTPTATPAKAKITQIPTQPAYTQTPLTLTSQANFETIPGFEAILAILGLIIVLRWLK